MFELIEKVVMTTIGVAAITQKKAEELVCEMKEKYKMSEEEGKQLVEKLQTMARENKDKVREMAEVEVQKVVERLGLVSVDELENLKKRIQELEARLNG
jgi:polyhydroxyalkanoate synthesis regulator phasin